MAKIFKYPIELTDEQEIKLPQGFRFLSAQMQNGVICLWAVVEPHRPMVRATIRVVGTGNAFEDDAACVYIGTVQDSPLVWHIFWK